MSFSATTAPRQGMLHAILRSSLWPEKKSPVTEASDCHCHKGKAMLHLSTHSQQVTLACSTLKPKGEFAHYVVQLFPGVWDEFHDGKIRLYQTPGWTERNIWREDTLAPLLQCKFHVRVSLGVCVLVLGGHWMRNLVCSSNFHIMNKMVCRIKKKKKWSQEKTKQTTKKK